MSLFKWGCQSNNYTKNFFSDMSKLLDHSMISPFFLALCRGADEMVSYMIGCMEGFLTTELEKHQPSSPKAAPLRPDEVLGDILGTHIPSRGTALEFTANTHTTKAIWKDLSCISSTGSLGPTEELPGHLKIIHALLTRDPNLVLRDTNFGKRDPAHPRRDFPNGTE